MSIQKFKSFEEAEKALWITNPDPAYFKRIRAFYKLFSKLSKFSYPKGVYKFHNLEEAEQHRMNAIVSSALNQNEVKSDSSKKD